MIKNHTDNLFALIKSLTKSEKRQFKIYAGRLGVNTDSKFISLFNTLDKISCYNEAVIYSSTTITKRQLANVKRHLYKQILKSLRLNPLQNNVRLQIREQQDNASILYHKGLYNQSLKVLAKAKELALQQEEKNLAYEIVEFEKVIESQYITRSMKSRAQNLVQQAEELSAANTIASQLSNLSLQLYSKFLKTGYVKTRVEAQNIEHFFEKMLPVYDIDELGFRERMWLYKANLWYGFLQQDFLRCYKYAVRWVDLFFKEPAMISVHPSFFLKGNHYLMECLYMLGRKEKLEESLQQLAFTVGQPYFPINDNTTTLSFLYLHLHKINVCFIDGSFERGIELIPGIEASLVKYGNRIDHHHQMIFNYKFASLYFGIENYSQAIIYLDLIIADNSLSMQEDLLCFARILNLMAHYEAGIDEHLETDLKRVYKFLIKMNAMHKVQQELVVFIRELGSIYPQDLNRAFIKLHGRLKKYENHPYERRAFLYLDIISWLESKIENRPVGAVVRAKYKRKNTAVFKTLQNE